MKLTNLDRRRRFLLFVFQIVMEICINVLVLSLKTDTVLGRLYTIVMHCFRLIYCGTTRGGGRTKRPKEQTRTDFKRTQTSCWSSERTDLRISTPERRNERGWGARTGERISSPEFNSRTNERTNEGGGGLNERMDFNSRTNERGEASNERTDFRI